MTSIFSPAALYSGRKAILGAVLAVCVALMTSLKAAPTTYVNFNPTSVTPSPNCPVACIYCQETSTWRYGYYYRKPDTVNYCESSQNDIPIPRFKCVVCRHTFSTLPECIAPRRWYP